MDSDSPRYAAEHILPEKAPVAARPDAVRLYNPPGTPSPHRINVEILINREL